MDDRRGPLGLAFALIAAALAGCAPTQGDVSLVEGPAIVDVVTPFEEPLTCLKGRVDQRLAFAVGGIPDLTGREQSGPDGAGRFVTQGAGDMVQSALFKTGVTLINRRDMGAAVLEAQWGIRDLATQRPVHLVVTGSINSLDFIPGGGAWVNVAGVGPRYRQNRILVGLDLSLTNVATGQIVSNISLLKQVHVEEWGMMAAQFAGANVVDVDLGGGRREALHFALRQMLQLGTFELLTQLLPAEEYEECAELLDEKFGTILGGQTAANQLRELQAEREAAATEGEAAGPEGDAPEPPSGSDSSGSDGSGTDSTGSDSSRTDGPGDERGAVEMGGDGSATVQDPGLSGAQQPPSGTTPQAADASTPPVATAERAEDMSGSDARDASVPTLPTSAEEPL